MVEENNEPRHLDSYIKKGVAAVTEAKAQRGGKDRARCEIVTNLRVEAPGPFCFFPDANR